MENQIWRYSKTRIQFNQNMVLHWKEIFREKIKKTDRYILVPIFFSLRLNWS